MSVRRGEAMTARELARVLGVSQSAVSRAFTPGASISPDMRERILAAADKHGYRPNVIASILSTRRSNIVAILISDLQNPFYFGLIEKLTRALQAVGQQSLLFNVTPGSDVGRQLVALRQYHVDAIIVVSATVLSGATLARATEGRRAVLVNRLDDGAGLTSVCCDNVAGARAIADHFYALGRRRAAYVAGLPNTSTNLERRHSFVGRLAELGMVLTRVVDGGAYTYDAGRRAALEIARETQTDAIFFANDILAAGGLDALRDEAGLSVPGEIAVAGFDDIAMADWSHYSLTTYRQPIDEMVAIAIREVMAPAAERATVATHRLAGELVVRRSAR
ncbi:LacI family DNA-binding transcriptional regulator [Aureimonas jatrophae]|uniref:DNA-binding transcriptional regulator, LacI/PurR family n=1 Tax=Aureimonas jatrophae TaxID=1166073 RepID=A0A1H0HST6_9HYPH|nr:LacI family DNA-binding transcriptional regulator [Aureimonas jatrophae]MBB3950755.1 DNA-binding LacI/PurR family transcriptional regulator [Aureimonas jatrophae]SDO22154.1 DNA-binding transcriptional regulator, LacI/PurR family [Aureimonas jatrophae]